MTTPTAIAFVQGFAACYTLLAAQATSLAPYEPTPTSETATRRALGSAGLSGMLTSRPKLTAAERKRIEAKASAARLGFVNGRFVG